MVAVVTAAAATAATATALAIVFCLFVCSIFSSVTSYFRVSYESIFITL